MDNFDGRIIKRLMAALLCALIFVSFMPDPAYAFEDQQEQTEITAGTDDPGTPDYETEAADPLSYDPETEVEDLVSAEPETEAPEGGLADDNTLLEGYMDSRLNEALGRPKPGSGMRKAAASKRRNTLSDNEKYIYDALRDFIYRVAEGEETTAETYIDVDWIFRPYFSEYGKDYFVITSSGLGISSAVCVRKIEDGRIKWPFSDEAKTKLYDFSKIVGALMADEPHALYWYDKTEGIANSVNGMLINTSGYTSDIYFKKPANPVLKVSFTVSGDYRPDGGSECDLDIAKTGATTQATRNAAAIIEDNKSVQDIDKLYAYKDKICAWTSYNKPAAYDSSYPYGDPWQMIYVFDDDKTNQVVCEGYSKAFQYLCDHTQFAYHDIECDTVTGIMKGSSGSGGHMWNILHMDDGRNYIADLTNSDTGMIGSRGGLFLDGAMEGGTVAAGYNYDVNGNGLANLTYTYDKETGELFSDDELTMADSDYIMPHVFSDAEYTWEEDGSSCTASGICLECEEPETQEAIITGSVKIPATCTEKGTTTYTAAFRNKSLVTQTKDITDIPVDNNNHAWDVGITTKAASEGIAGSKFFTCTRCGKSRTEIIPAILYPNDLLAVKISKPKAGKKKVTVKWKKVSKKNQKKIQGVEIQIATDPGFTDILKTANGSKKKTSKVIKGLNPKTKYYVRIRAYKNASDGKHVSNWKSKSVKIK